MDSGQVRRVSLAGVIGLGVGVAIGGLVFVAARRALKTVALAGASVSSGVATGTLLGIGTYVARGQQVKSDERTDHIAQETGISVRGLERPSQQETGRHSRQSSPPRRSSGPHSNPIQESSSTSSESTPSTVKFSAPGIPLPSIPPNDQELATWLDTAEWKQLANPTLRVLYGEGWQTLRSGELDWVVGPKGIYVVHQPSGSQPRGEKGQAVILSLLNSSEELALPLSDYEGLWDGGLFSVEGSNHRELACCNSSSVVICNFETQQTQEFHLPEALQSRQERRIYRSSTGDYWMMAHSSNLDGNDFYVAKLSPVETKVQRLKVGSYNPASGAITFGLDDSGVSIPYFKGVTGGRNPVTYYTALSEEGGSEPVWEKVEDLTVKRGLVYGCVKDPGGRQDKDRFVVRSPSRAEIRLDRECVGVQALEGSTGPIAVAWSKDRNILLIQNGDLRSRTISVEIGLETVRRVTNLFEGSVLALHMTDEICFIRTENGAILRRVDVRYDREMQMFDTPWGVVLVGPDNMAARVDGIRSL